MAETDRLISVIVPVYNAAAYLKRCVESIRKQTHQRLELLLVDDGSTDGGGALCDRLAEEEKRIRVLHRPNGGVSAARNAGLDAALGEFVSFVDADDWLAEDMLSHLLSLLDEKRGEVAVCGFYKCDSFEKAFISSVLKPVTQGQERRPETAEAVPAAQYLLTHVLHGDTRCWSKLYRRDAIGETRFRESLSIGEDMLFFMDLLPRLSAVLVTDYRGYFYFENEQGAMAAPFQDSYLDQITCWQEAKARIPRTQEAAWRRVNAILAVSVMLVVNKLSLLPRRERRSRKETVRLCERVLQEALEQINPAQDLERAYRIKIRAFRTLPGLYMSAYRFGKRRQKSREERRRQEENRPEEEGL